jgi:phosphatidylglycerol:prolipoprotein diacylglycerol transferase
MARRRAAKARKPRVGVLGTPSESRAQTARGYGQTAPHQATSVDSDEPQALVATHWFDSGDAAGEPCSVTVRFSGRRLGTRGYPRAGDTFVKDETVDGIVPGTGPVSITTWVYGVLSGEWTITSEVTKDSRGMGHAGMDVRSRAADGRPVRRAVWSWRRWAISTGPETSIRTRWALLAPLARQPAVQPGIYTALGIFAILFALVVQAAILGRGDVSVGRTLAASAIAIASGLIGAKLWYAALHPGESIIKGGWAVDGFLIVVPVVAAVTLLAFDLPIGLILDASTPGIFFAVAIGRVGCFFTGCCAGRCTASRWGIWSSDRRVGARRVPTQLFESGAGLLIGAMTLLLVLGEVSPIPGGVFVAAFAAYAVVRQILLRLRVEQRRSPRSVPLTGVAAAIVVVAVLAMSMMQGT